MKNSILFIILLFALSLFGYSQCFAFDKPIKEPNVSGSFYPANKNSLSSMLDKYLKSTNSKKIDGRVYGIISPHAGYIYSGPVAANAYKIIEGKEYNTVVIISPSHYVHLNQIAVFANGSFKTPLGVVAIDSEFTKKLLTACKNIVHMPEVFEKEHALEVQIPFLQKTLKNFSIVPLIIGSDSYSLCEELANSLAKIIDGRKDVLIVASTDMSHFHNQKEANLIDHKTLSLIENNKPKELFKNLRSSKCELCGGGAVITTMLSMEKLGVNNIKLLQYATSADTSHSAKNKVVGYSSFIFFKKFTESNSENKKPREKKTMLTKNQKNELITLARNSIHDFVTEKKRQQIKTTDPLFQEKRGAFVTIKKNGQLRGCIGRIVADKPLINVVDEMAIQAATGDPRFPPVKREELDALELEISVLSPLKEINAIESIEVGKHGLIIQKGFQSGLLLPQVATEYGWTREEFLEHTCLKAGLNPDAWKNNAKIITFSAEVFQENN